MILSNLFLNISFDIFDVYFSGWLARPISLLLLFTHVHLCTYWWCIHIICFCAVFYLWTLLIFAFTFIIIRLNMLFIGVVVVVAASYCERSHIHPACIYEIASFLDRSAWLPSVKSLFFHSRCSCTCLYSDLLYFVLFLNFFVFGCASVLFLWVCLRIVADNRCFHFVPFWLLFTKV